MAVLLVVAVVVAGCASTSEAEEARQRQRAEELVAATQDAGIAPRLTVEVAEALYGPDAPAVCRAFEDGRASSADVILRGNLAQGRRKVVTPDAVLYARLVVRTYCPDQLAPFEQTVADLQPLDTGS